MIGVLSAEVLDALRRQPRTVVVTPNERLARAVRVQWNTLQKESGATRWRPVTALSWNGWLREQWNKLLVEGGSEAPLLSRAQERRVWEALIGPEEGPEVARALADVAARALQQLAAYDGLGRWATQRRRATGDAAAFGAWCAAMERWSTEFGWTPEAYLPERLVNAWQERSTAGDPVLLLAGSELLPAQKRVLAMWESRGGSVEHRELPAIASETARCVSAADAVEEVRLCARWAATRLQQKETRCQSIAIVTSDLSGEREELEAALRESLVDDDLFEFSLGRSLADEPGIRCALLALRWAAGPLEPADMQELLLSPYFGASDERERDGRADLLRVLGSWETPLRPEISVKGLGEVIRRHELGTRVPALAGQLVALLRADPGDTRRAFATWAEWVRGTLADAQWMRGNLRLTSREFQVLKRWNAVLEEFETLDVPGFDSKSRKADFEEAVQTLLELLEETVFAPESRGAPVQVIGLHEARSGRFDEAWVLRAHENGWPERERLLPLLPTGLQVELGMPGSHPDAMKSEARHVLEQIAACAERVIFSYARVTPQGVAQGPAPLLQVLPARAISAEEIFGPRVDDKPAEMERFEDQAWVAAPLPVPLPGGVHVLELQASCGFRAFAEARLGSREMETRTPGFSARQRGSLVHTVLEAFWREVRDHATLMLMEAGDVRRMLERLIDEAIGKELRHNGEPGAWGRGYTEVQRRRFTRVLGGWLEYERERPAFRVVQREEAQSSAIGELNLKLRIDRVDEDVATGRRLVMDYKTGAAAKSSWEGERPDLPQVPAYLAVLRAEAGGEKGFGGAAFGMVQAGDGCKLEGYMERAMLPHGRGRGLAREELEERFSAWEITVRALADEVAAGDARVRPKDFPSTCGRCAQRMLCRVDAALLEGSDEENEAAEDE